MRMKEERLAQLHATDPAILTDVVRQDQRSPSFEIINWSVQPLSDRGFVATDGLWCFSGQGRDATGTRSWSVAVKIVARQDPELPETNVGYWKRELMVPQSGLAEALSGRVRAPRFYRVDEKPDAGWVWMERVGDTRPGPWTIDDYRFVGRQFGMWNGTAHARPAPAAPWLARDHCRTWLEFFNEIEQAWLFPLHAKHVTPDLRQRHDRFWGERETFFRAFEALPQVVSHRDPQRRNMFIQTSSDGQDELVLVDWAFYGWGPIGCEVAFIGPVSAEVMAFPPRDTAEVSEAAYAGYLAGLRDAGWKGNLDQVRLAFLIGTVLWVGGSIVGWLAWWCTPEARAKAEQQFGLAEEQLYLSWFPLLSYTLDCADEARALMSVIG
jgi:hypothetical protein